MLWPTSGTALIGLEQKLQLTKLELADAKQTQKTLKTTMEEHRGPLQLARNRLRCRAMRPLQEKKKDLAEVREAWRWFMVKRMVLVQLALVSDAG